MNDAWPTWLWGLGWSALTLGFFALPLWPAWRELRQGTDASPLDIDGNDDGRTSYHARSLAKHLPRFEDQPPETSWHRSGRSAVRAQHALTLDKGERAAMIVSSDHVTLKAGSRVTRALHARQLHSAGTRLPARASAAETMVLEAGSSFRRLDAALILTPPFAPVHPMDSRAATAISQRRFHDGDLHIEAGEHVQADLVVRGNLHVGENACLSGHVKVHGHACLAPHARLLGALFATGNVHAQAHSMAQGPICATGNVQLDTGFQGGQPDLRCSISGWQVQLAPGVRIYGSIMAVAKGTVSA